MHQQVVFRFYFCFARKEKNIFHEVFWLCDFAEVDLYVWGFVLRSPWIELEVVWRKAVRTKITGKPEKESLRENASNFLGMGLSVVDDDNILKLIWAFYQSVLCKILVIFWNGIDALLKEFMAICKLAEINFKLSDTLNFACLQKSV